MRLAGGRGSFFQTKRVFASITLIPALPSFIITLKNTLSYPTPSAWAAAPGEFADIIIIGIFVCWGSVAGFLGSRRAFGVAPIRGVLLLIVLPWLVLVPLYALLTWLVIAGNASLTDVRHPKTFESTAISLKHPGNWTATPDADDPPALGVTVKHGDYELNVYASSYFTDQSLDEITQRILLNWRNMQYQIVATTPVTQWGKISGTGLEVQLLIHGQPYTGKFILTELDEAYVAQLTAVVFTRDLRVHAPGIDMIARSVRFTPPEQQSPDLALARDVHCGEFNTTVPGNWFATPWQDPATGTGMDIEAPDSSWIVAWVYDTDGMVYEELFASVRSIAENVDQIDQTGTLSSWGRLSGAGLTLRTVTQDNAWIVRLVCVPLSDGRMLEINEFIAETRQEQLTPGLDMVRKGFFLAPGLKVDVSRIPERPPEAEIPDPGQPGGRPTGRF